MIREVLGQSMVYGLAIILSRGMLMIALLVVALFMQPADYGALVMITTIGFLVNVTVALDITHIAINGTDIPVYVWWSEQIESGDTNGFA